jgi:hypothetical protein
MSGVTKLGICLPKFAGFLDLVAFPLVLPMGWTESPSFFCCFMETVCDLTNEVLCKNLQFPTHHLEEEVGNANFEPNPECSFDMYEQQATLVA